MERPEFSRVRVTEQPRTLGVREGGMLLVHTFFRAVRPVEGGPLGMEVYGRITAIEDD